MSRRAFTGVAEAEAHAKVTSPSRKIVPFSGGDPGANAAVYEPDATAVKPFKRAWNYRDMPLDLHDPYDLEMQAAREHELEEAERRLTARIRQEEVMKKQGPPKPDAAGYSEGGYKQQARTGSTRTPSVRPRAAAAPPDARTAVQPFSPELSVMEEGSMDLAGASLFQPSLLDQDGDHQDADEGAAPPPPQAPPLAMSASELLDGGASTESWAPAGFSMSSVYSSVEFGPGVEGGPSVASRLGRAGVGPLPHKSAYLAAVDDFEGVLASPPVKGRSDTSAFASPQHSSILSPSSLPYVDINTPPRHVPLPAAYARALGSPDAEPHDPGDGLRPKKAPHPLGLRSIAPFPTKLPAYMGPNRYAQAKHKQALVEAGFLEPEPAPPEPPPEMKPDPYAEALPLEVLTQVQRPRLSQTLPIKKGGGAEFWERDGDRARVLGIGDDDTVASGGVEGLSRENTETGASGSGSDSDEDGVAVQPASDGERGQAAGVQSLAQHGEKGNRGAPTRTSGQPASRAARWAEGIVPKVALGKLVPWGGDDRDADGGSGRVSHRTGFGDSDSSNGSDSEAGDDDERVDPGMGVSKSGPPFPGAERLWFYKEDEWHTLPTRSKLSRVCCCNRCFPQTPPVCVRFLERWDSRHVRNRVRSEERAKHWKNWKKNNPHGHKALWLAYYFGQRFLTIATFLVNCYVVADLKHGQQSGLAAAVAIVLVLQWLLSAALMYRVAFSMMQHQLEEHYNEYLERLLKHFKFAFALAGPLCVFLADWAVPALYLCRRVNGDMASSYWSLRMVVNLGVSFGCFIIELVITNALGLNPHTYRYVTVGPLAAGIVFNAFLVAMVFTEVYRTAEARHQTIVFHLKEVLWGGLNPLPHYANMREGQLSEVDYEGVIRTTDDVIMLFRALERVAELGKLGTLRVMWLRRCWIVNDGCVHLHKILRLKELQLRELHLDYNYIRQKGAAELGAAVKHSKTLQIMSLYENEVGDGGCVELALGMRENASITKFDLSYNRIGNEGVLALAEMLRHNYTLQELRLEGNKFDHIGAVGIADALTYNTSLSSLCLGRNRVGEKGAVAFGDYFSDRRNTALLSLELIGCGINDTGMIELCGGVQRASALRRLDLADNPVTHKAAGALGAAFAHSVSLTSLDLGYLRLGDDGITPVVTALQTNTSLSLLDVSGNQLNFGVRGLVQVLLVQNTTLTTLVVGTNDALDDAYKASVRKTLGPRIMFQAWK